MKPALKPFARYRFITFLTVALLLTAFLLLLLVSLSLTIIKPIYLLIIRSTVVSPPLSIATELRFGVWGVCATSALNQATLLTNPGPCFGPKLGYDVPDYVSNAVGISQAVIDKVESALLVVLILHPIAAGFALVSFICSFFLYSHGFAIFTLVITILTAILTSISFAIDVALVLVAKNQLDQASSLSIDIIFGNGVWMILGAVIATWLGIITLSARACYCCGVRRRSHEHHHHHHHDSLTEHY